MMRSARIKSRLRHYCVPSVVPFIVALALALQSPAWAAESAKPVGAPVAGEGGGLRNSLKGLSLKKAAWMGIKYGPAAYVLYKGGQWGIDYLRGKRPVFGVTSRFTFGATVAAGAVAAGSLGFIPEIGLGHSLALGVAATAFGAELVNQTAWYLGNRKHRLGTLFGMSAAIGIPAMLWALNTNIPNAMLPAIGLGTALGARLVLNPVKRASVALTGAAVSTAKQVPSKLAARAKVPFGDTRMYRWMAHASAALGVGLGVAGIWALTGESPLPAVSGLTAAAMAGSGFGLLVNALRMAPGSSEQGRHGQASFRGEVLKMGAFGLGGAAAGVALVAGGSWAIDALAGSNTPTPAPPPYYVP